MGPLQNLGGSSKIFKGRYVNNLENSPYRLSSILWCSGQISPWPKCHQPLIHATGIMRHRREAHRIWPPLVHPLLQGAVGPYPTLREPQRATGARSGSAKWVGPAAAGGGTRSEERHGRHVRQGQPWPVESSGGQ